MNKVWNPQHIEDKYISLAGPLEDFENILIEDILIINPYISVHIAVHSCWNIQKHIVT